MKQYFLGKRIAVTGASGTVGSELIRQLLTCSDFAPEEVIGLDNDESNLFFLEQSFLDDERAHFFLLDIRDLEGLNHRLQDVDIVFHTAAFKHVILCERSPAQAVQTNIIGIQNVITASIANNVHKTIFTSSDKAVNPTSVMGTSKLMGERLMTAANSSHRDWGTVFTSTRFGNVLGSSGSVIPIFKKQIAEGGPVTLTDARMTRFVMSLKDSVRLVIDSACIAQGGEVLITKMPVIRIKDLATAMIEELAPLHGYDPEDIEIREIGMKAGEKLYEELMSGEEIRRSIELPRYFSVLPAFEGIYRDITYNYTDIISKNVDNPYISENETPLTITELRAFLKDNELLPELTSEPEKTASSDKASWQTDENIKAKVA